MPDAKKRLILAYPNQRWQKDDMNTVWDLNPGTLCLLAAVVKDIVDIKIIDAQFYDMTQEEFKKEIEEYAPDFFGVSVMTSEYQDTLDISVDIAKKVNPDIITIAGGIHVTTKYDYAMKNSNLDYGIRGEGEDALRELLLYLTGQGAFPSKGVVYRKAGKVIAQEQVWIEDLTKLPWPDYSFVNFEDYSNRGARVSPNRPTAYPTYRMLTTRGCPFGCSFCQVELIAGKKVRARDPEDVVNELLYMKEKYGIKSIMFEDDNILMAQGGKYAKKLFKLMIEKELNLEWVGIAFALFLFTDEILDLMQQSGCKGVNVSIESGSERVLKEIVKKPIKDLKLIPEIIQKVHDRGIYCITSFIIGFPGETWEEIRQTISFAEHCGADYVKIFVAVPLYGTELYNIALATNSLTHDDEFPKTDWRHSQIKSDEWSAKDISILRAYEWDRINFAPHKIDKVAEIWGVDKEHLKEIRKKTRDSLEF